MITLEHAPGRPSDIHGDTHDPVVLLWHGMEPDQRGLLAPLAQTLVDAGWSVVVPDWDSSAADGGRADLLGSARLARELLVDNGHDPDALAVVGWSLGGTAAVSLTVHAKRLGIGVGGTVTLAAAIDAVDPISGSLLPTPLPRPPAGRDARVSVLHGNRDTVVDPGVGRATATRLAASGWDVELVSTETDHAGIAMTAYDADAGKYVSTEDDTRLLQGSAVVEALRRVSSSSTS